MKRALLRLLRRYLHVLVTVLMVTLFLSVVIMERVMVTSRTSVTGTMADLLSVSRSQTSQPQRPAVPNGTEVGMESAQSSSCLLAGRPRNYQSYITIGIPTLTRPKGEYFFATLASLLQQSTPAHHRNMTLVVMLADRDPANNLHTLDKIKATYSRELGEGLVLVVSAPYTDHIFSARHLKRTFNDSLDRVRWRSKQNLDYAALMDFSTNISTYYLQIEDDVTAAPNYIQHIQTFVEQNRGRQWAGLEVCPHGFIGKLFRSLDLPKLVTILRTFYLEMPCDFLIHHFYNLMLQTKVIRRKGNLFFHQGKFSSLANVTRKTDRSSGLMAFKPVVKRHGGAHNPPADLYTSIAVYRTYRIAAAYNLKTDAFFWGKDVRDGDDVTVVFHEPQSVDRIVVESGLNDKAGVRRDFIRNGTVEYGAKAFVGKHGSKALCTDTHDLGVFVNGRFDQKLHTTDLVQCFTIVITHAQKEWVAIPEIAVILATKV